jgi:hypothetical protein
MSDSVPAAAEGWGWPTNSRKAHYFRGYMSLCGRWMYGGRMEEDGDVSLDDCSTCRKRLEALKAKTPDTPKTAQP